MIISEIQSEIGHCSCGSAKFKAPADFSHHAILCMTLSLIARESRTCPFCKRKLIPPPNFFHQKLKSGMKTQNIKTRISTSHLHAILLFSNYLHDQNPIFHSLQYFQIESIHSGVCSIDHWLVKSGGDNFPFYTVRKNISNMFVGFLCPQCPGLGNLGNTRSKLSLKCATTLEIGRLANRGSYPTTASRFCAIEIWLLVYHFGPFPLIRSIFFQMHSDQGVRS